MNTFAGGHILPDSWEFVELSLVRKFINFRSFLVLDFQRHLFGWPTFPGK